MMDILKRIKKRVKEEIVIDTKINDIYKNKTRPCVFPPLTEREMKSIETELGFSLPPLLRKIYREVGNGGYGLGYGLLSFRDGLKADYNQDIIETYQESTRDHPEDPFWLWPKKLLKICNIGCGMYFCVDCSTVPGAIILFEPNGHNEGESWDHAFIPFTFSTEEWLLFWLDDKEWSYEDAWNRKFYKKPNGINYV